MTTSSENESGSLPLHFEKCSLVLVDVAGTTTSIDFVKDTLFPFVNDQAEAFLGSKWDEDSVKESLKQIQEKDQELDLAKAVDLVKKLTLEDSSNQGLKTLQGLIYKQGYEKGDLKAHVFEDVAEAFETWAKSRQIAVYSTGSVDSQKLLFKHTVSGDLSAHISNYFDQTVGKKTESESYKKIAEETKIPTEEIVFITDDVKEATAAKTGGLHAVLIKRKGNPEVAEEESKDFLIVNTFSELVLDKTSKRKIEEGTANTEAPPSKVPKTDSETTEKTEEKPESMEIDPEKTETATVKETENLVKNTPEKTETEKDNKTDTEMTEVEKETTETVVEVATAAKEVEESPATEEPKPAVEEKPTEELKKDSEEPKEEAKTTTDEPKAEDIEKPSPEEPQPEPAKDKESEPEPEKAEKTETTAEQVTTEEESMKNGNEEGETSTPKTEEKENKSVLANGVENGNKDESEVVDNATTEEKESETAEVTNDETVDNKDDDNEVKVKKLEESAESKTVSVEV